MSVGIVVENVVITLIDEAQSGMLPARVLIQLSEIAEDADFVTEA